MAEPLEAEAAPPPPYAPPQRRRSARWTILLALVTFGLGVAGAVWLAGRGYLADLGLVDDSRQTPVAMRPVPSPMTASGDAVATIARQEAEVSSVEARLALLEDRLSRIDLQADAASGNAARAENLLIAFAARRMIDQGKPLRHLADQLQLRFADAQPRAVNTIVQFARNPVTSDELFSRLEALSPQLTGTSPDTTLLDRALNDLTGLFTVQREPSEVIGPQAGIERARVMLRAGRIEDAVAQVRRLPGARAADKWIADAQRYAQVQDALDLIETAAMFEPNRLLDGTANPVDEPGPLPRPTLRAE
jgi:hypothetical protein